MKNKLLLLALIFGILNIVCIYNSSAQSDDKVDINTASKAELASMPGLGPLTAERIVEYREKNNGFKSIDQLINIKGIGQERLSRIKLWATISIPKEGEKILTEKKPISEDNKLDINKASKRDLELLPGIGPKIASNIIEYRTQVNGFKSTQELMYIKGIGTEKFDGIKDLVTAGYNSKEN